MTSPTKRPPACERPPREHYPDDPWQVRLRVLLLDPTVKAEPARVLTALWTYANKAGATWVSKDTLRAELRTEPRSFARHVAQLVDAGKVLYGEGFTAAQSAELHLDLYPKPSAHDCGWLIAELASVEVVAAWRAQLGAPAAVRPIVLPVTARRGAEPTSRARPTTAPPAEPTDVTLRALEALLSPAEWAAEGDVTLRAEASARLDGAAKGRDVWLRHMAEAIKYKSGTWPGLKVTTPSVAWLAGGRRGSDPRTWAPLGQALGAAERRWRAEKAAGERVRHQAAMEAEASRREAEHAKAERARREREVTECAELRAELIAAGLPPLPEQLVFGTPGYTVPAARKRNEEREAWCRAHGVQNVGEDSGIMRKALDMRRKAQASAAQHGAAAMVADMARSRPADDTPFDGADDPLPALTSMLTRKLG